jgi:predicted RNase H-like HicB family nuclease
MENELRLKITYIKAEEGGYVGRVDGISGTISEADTLDELKQNLFDSAKAIISFNEDDQTNNFPFFGLGKEVFEDELVLTIK